jgi:hypothetical protein
MISVAQILNYQTNSTKKNIFCIEFTNTKTKSIDVLHIDGDFYERRESVLPNFSGEAKNLI